MDLKVAIKSSTQVRWFEIKIDDVEMIILRESDVLAKKI